MGGGSSKKASEAPAPPVVVVVPPQPDIKVVNEPPPPTPPPKPTPPEIPAAAVTTVPPPEVKVFAFPPTTQPNYYFKTVHSAIRWQKPNVAEILDHPDTVDCLDEKTGNLPTNFSSRTTHTLHSNTCSVLLVLSSSGNVPIHIAAQNGYMEIVRILLDKSCAINAVNKKGFLFPLPPSPP